MDEQLISLYHQHVAAAFDRQLRLADLLAKKGAKKRWDYDTETATLRLGTLKFEAPLIGSHAEHNDSWLWAWSNKHLHLTLTNRALGDTVRATVHRLGVHGLSAPGFSLEPLLGPDLTEHAAHVLGVILTRELDFDAYYLTPYDGGQGLVLIRDKRLKFTEKHPLRRILAQFQQVISAMPVFDHKAAFTGYAHSYALNMFEEPHKVMAMDGRDSLTASFDVHNRLIEIEGTVAPVEPKAANKVAWNSLKLKSKKPARKPTPKKKRPAKPMARKPARSARKVR